MPPVSSRTQRMSKPLAAMSAQRAELFQPLIQFGRAQVAEQFKVFTQRQQRAIALVVPPAAGAPIPVRQWSRTGSRPPPARIRRPSPAAGEFPDGRWPPRQRSYWLVVMCMAKRWRTASSTFIAWFITSGQCHHPAKRQYGNSSTLHGFLIVLFILSFALQFFFDFGGAPNVVQL